MKGTGSYTPPNVVTNHDLASIVDTSDEWIRTRTGIVNRHISAGENTSELAYEAGKRALEAAGVSGESVDIIICATVTPDNFTPATACIVQNLLGAKKAIAFDLNAACTGLMYGIATAAQFLENGVYQNALVLGAETLSKIIDWKDRNTCVLFGDGAGAVYLERSDEQEGKLLQMTLSADGSRGELLQCPAMPLQNIITTAGISEPIEQETEKQTVKMQGGEVFKYAVKAMVHSVNEVLTKEKITIDEIDWIVPHQANVRIIESAAKLLKAQPDKFYINLSEYGNTSSASIGLALDELSRSEKLKRGQKIILVGFGGGMTSGAILIQW